MNLANDDGTGPDYREDLCNDAWDDEPEETSDYCEPAEDYNEYYDAPETPW